MISEGQYNILQKEPVLLSAPVTGALVDLISGTGLNSHLAGLLAAVLVALLRFVVTSPATAQIKDRQIAALKLK